MAVLALNYTFLGQNKLFFLLWFKNVLKQSTYHFIDHKLHSSGERSKYGRFCCEWFGKMFRLILINIFICKIQRNWKILSNFGGLLRIFEL